MLEFPGGRGVRIFEATALDDVAVVLSALNIERPQGVVFLVAGSATLKPALFDEISAFVDAALRPILQQPKFLLVDGATEAGVTNILSKGSRDRPGIRLGVAPRKKVCPEHGETAHIVDPGHSHLILTAGDHFGSETPVYLQLAEHYRQIGVPVACLLVGGGPVAVKELQGLTRVGVPIFVIAGSRRLADQVARWTHPRGVSQHVNGLWATAVYLLALALRAFLPGSVSIWLRRNLRVQLRRADVVTYHLGSDPDDLKRDVQWVFSRDAVLKDAWRRFATYDLAADRRQSRYRWLLAATLLLSICSTVLALASFAYKLGCAEGRRDAIWCSYPSQRALILRYGLVGTSASAALISAYISRLSHDRQWVALRSAAETIKAEIYKLRGGSYADPVGGSGLFARKRELKRSEQYVLLVRRLRWVDDFLVDRGIHIATLEEVRHRPRAAVDIPIEMSAPMLSGERYLAIRLQDQLNYFAKKGPRLGRELFRWIMVVPTLAFVAAILGALDEAALVILFSGLVAAAGAWYQSKIIRESLGQTSRAIQDLRSIRSEWQVRPPSTLAPDPDLVNRTEAVLRTEHAGWLGALDAHIAAQERPEKTGSV